MKMWLLLTDAYAYSQNTSISLPLSNPCPLSQYHNLQTSPSLSISISQPSSFSPQDDMSSVGYFQTSVNRSNRAPTLESPRIEITAYGQFSEDEVENNSVPSGQASQFHSDINFAKCRLLSWPHLPQPSEQRVFPQLPFRCIIVRIRLFVQLRQLAAELALAVSLRLPERFLISAVLHPRCFSTTFSVRFSPYKYHRRQLGGHPRLATKFSLWW